MQPHLTAANNTMTNPPRRKFRMLLDTELARRSPELVIPEETTSAGPTGNVVWTSVLYVNGLGPFVATGAKKKHARDAASRLVLEVIGVDPEDAVLYGEEDSD